jgi:hypothetical protein
MLKSQMAGEKRCFNAEKGLAVCFGHLVKWDRIDWSQGNNKEGIKE